MRSASNFFRKAGGGRLKFKRNLPLLARGGLRLGLNLRGQIARLFSFGNRAASALTVAVSRRISLPLLFTIAFLLYCYQNNSNAKPDGSGDEFFMKNETKQIVRTTIELPAQLNEKLIAEARRAKRSRHAQMIFALEKFFETVGEKNVKPE